MFITSQTVLVC